MSSDTTEIGHDEAQPGTSVRLAALLQCVPLLFLASCTGYVGVTRVTSVTDLAITAPLAFLSAVSWGLGYAYLDRLIRFAVAWLCGGIGTCFAFFITLSVIAVGAELGGGPFAVVLVAVCGIVFIAGVVLCAVDAWRLAERDNVSAEFRRASELEEK